MLISTGVGNGNLQNKLHGVSVIFNVSGAGGAGISELLAADSSYKHLARIRYCEDAR